MQGERAFSIGHPMELYHFSEEPSIRDFVPRPPPSRAPGLPGSASPVPDEAKIVWAIDAWHAPLYYFPRDCPRIVLWRLPTTTEADAAAWFGERDAKMIACIEWAWLERMRATGLYRYTFPAEGFTFLEGPNASPGTWLSSETAVPLRVEAMGSLLDRLAEENVELRLMRSLAPLRGVWDTTLHASGVRLRNAVGWPGA